jgi:ABC-2 type transport system permease protein
MTAHNWLSTFWAMVRKELIVMARYPINFIASFGQVFLIVAVFTLGGRTFIPSQDLGVDNGPSNTAGVVIYGFILFLFLSDTLWTIGYNVRNEQVQGTLEQLYLSPASKFASLVSRVTNTLVWTGLLSIAGSALMASMIGRLPFENPLRGLYLLAMALSGTFGIGFAFAALKPWQTCCSSPCSSCLPISSPSQRFHPSFSPSPKPTRSPMRWTLFVPR